MSVNMTRASLNQLSRDWRTNDFPGLEIVVANGIEAVFLNLILNYRGPTLEIADRQK